MPRFIRRDIVIFTEDIFLLPKYLLFQANSMIFKRKIAKPLGRNGI